MTPARAIGRTAAGWVLLEGERVRSLRHPLSAMLRGAAVEPVVEVEPSALLAPVDDQDVWAAGVTYERSLTARSEESDDPAFYDRVYTAERPELFYKASPGRVRGPDEDGCIRSDSTWDVPEPELALVLDADGRIFGYTIGDDISSRSIEGENPLYLPQAKIYEGSCALGPWIVPADDVSPPFDIELTVRRNDSTVYRGSTSTSKMVREFEDLARVLTRSMRFPSGVVLMTGTGVVPDESFTLTDGDVVEIAVDQIGTLRHGVRTWEC